jgi:hypothetical protein
MTEELEPVGDQEHILRRVHVNHYRDGLPSPIQRAAFRPNEQDTTGIPVYRERFVSSYADVLTIVKPEKRGNYYVSRLSVRALRGLGLDVVPDPDPGDIPGHSVIPQLSWSNYQADHDRLADVQEQLAALGSQDIVHRPTA